MEKEESVLNEVSKARLERVWYILNKLEVTKPNAEIERRMGGSPGNISRYLNGKLKMSDNFYKKFLEKFPIEEGTQIEKLLNEISRLKKDNLEKENKIRSNETVIQTLTNSIENLNNQIIELKKGLPPRRTGTEG